VSRGGATHPLLFIRKSKMIKLSRCDCCEMGYLGPYTPAISNLVTLFTGLPHFDQFEIKSVCPNCMAEEIDYFEETGKSKILELKENASE